MNFDNPLVLGSVMHCGQGNKIKLIVVKLQPLSATDTPAKVCIHARLQPVTGQCVHTNAIPPKSACVSIGGACASLKPSTASTAAVVDFSHT